MLFGSTQKDTFTCSSAKREGIEKERRRENPGGVPFISEVEALVLRCATEEYIRVAQEMK